LNSQQSRPSAAYSAAGGAGAGRRKWKADQQLQKSKDDKNQYSNCKKPGYLEPKCWFKNPEKASIWWKEQTAQQHARITAQEPVQQVQQQLQIADQPFTKITSQLPQQDQHTYLTGANNVNRAPLNSFNNSKQRGFSQTYW
jgi:hypothetical protein